MNEKIERKTLAWIAAENAVLKLSYNIIVC